MIGEILFLILGITTGGIAASGFWYYRDTRYIDELEKDIENAHEDYRKDARIYREEIKKWQIINAKAAAREEVLKHENRVLRNRLHALENESATRRLSNIGTDAASDDINFK